MLERVGLGDRTEFLPRNLSGGQQQRVAIASGLGERSTTAGLRRTDGRLDGPNGQKIMELIRDVDEPPTVASSSSPMTVAYFNSAIVWRNSRTDGSSVSTDSERGHGMMISIDSASGSRFACAVLAAWSILTAGKTAPMPTPIVAPHALPGDTTVAASGIIEAANENVRIGPPPPASSHESWSQSAIGCATAIRSFNSMTGTFARSS